MANTCESVIEIPRLSTETVSRETWTNGQRTTSKHNAFANYCWWWTLKIVG